ncbi:MAG: hypothetical protein SFW35_04075 [Chitinophagales bacterium]|nr:hypothetical protein [Chitinophagales bacterium]
MFQLVYPYLFSQLAYLIVLSIIGFVVIRYSVPSILNRQQPYTTLFISSILGMVLFTAFFAIIKSRGLTINIVFIPLLIAFIYESRKVPSMIEGVATKSFIIPGTLLISLSLSCFALMLSTIYVGGPFPFIVESGNDYAYHAMIAKSLGISGIENKFVPEQLLAPDYPGVHLFHFFDLWQTAGISSITGLNHYLVYKLMVDSSIALLSIMGMIALLEQFFSIRPWMILVGAVLFFFGHLYLPVFMKIYYLSKANYRLHHFGTTAISLPKLMQIVPFAILSCLFFVRRHYALGFLILLSIGLVYMSALAVTVFVTIALLLLNLKFQWFERKEALRVCGYTLLFALIVAVFFKLFGTGVSEGKDKLSLELFSPSAWKTRINIAVLTTIQVSALYFLHALLLIGLVVLANRLKVLSKQAFFFLFLACGIYFAGLGLWLLAYKNQDGMQLLGNNFPIINVLLVTVSLVLISSLISGQVYKKPALFIAILFISISAYNGFVYIGKIGSRKEIIKSAFDGHYLKSIAETNRDKSNLIGVFLKGKEEYTGNSLAEAHKTSQSYKLSWYLALMPQYLSTTNISIFDIPIPDDVLNRERLENANSGTQFYQFVANQKAKGTFVSVEKSQLDFIDYYHITYMIASRSAIVSNGLLAKVKQTLVDPVSGERFMLLQ